MNRRYINLERSLCKELTALEEKYRNGQEMSEGDLRRVNLLAHSMKSLMSYIKMQQEIGNDYEENNYRSFDQNNSYMNSYNNTNSYNANSYDNYLRDNRYMNHDNNMDRRYPPMPYPDRRW